MLLLELAVFVLCSFGKVEFDKASSVFRCSVIWCCDSRPGSICVVWVCLLLSPILRRQQEVLLVLYSSCPRVVWVWCFFFLLLFIILMASMCIAPIYFPETEEHSPTSIRRQMSSCHIPHPLLKGCERQKMYFVCEWVMHWKPIERM